MMMKKIFTLFVLMGLVIGTTQAQDNPIRIGLKLGKPNIAGLAAEYALPFIGGRIAPTAEFSYIPIKTDLIDPEITYTYFGFGGNFYFFGDGKGLYAHLGYGYIGLDATFTSQGEEGTATVNSSLFNMKLGWRKGKRIYFVSEIGYGLGKDATEVKVRYANRVETEKIPSALVGGLMFNSGIGIAF